MRTLFERLDGVAAKNSEVLFDANNRALLSSPFMTARLGFVRELGAPWQFGNDDPTSILPRGWSATADDISEVGISRGRWPLPPTPKDMVDVPRTWFVDGRKIASMI